MKLSLAEAATRLGKAERQIRYLIQQGNLPATKSGGRWIIDLSDVEIDGEPEAKMRKEKALEQAVGDALAKEPTLQRKYSLRS